MIYFLAIVGTLTIGTLLTTLLFTALGIIEVGTEDL